MLSPRWRKILRDLWSNKTRTTLVVASIAVGLFAVGVVQHIRLVMLTEMQRVYDESNAAHATIFTSGVDDAMIESIGNIDEVAQVEGRGSVSVQVEVEPGHWEPLSLVAVPDFENIQVDQLHLVYEVDDPHERNAAASQWPEDDEFILESSALGLTDVIPPDLAVGKEFPVELPNGRIRTLTLSGLTYDATVLPATFSGIGYGYIDLETYERLSTNSNYTQVNIRVQGDAEEVKDIEYVRSVANEAADRIESTQAVVQRVQVVRPGELPLQSLFDSITLILTPLGGLALFLGAILVVNTMSALMSQQTRQIGVMKSIGANRGQIMVMYLGSVFIYSVLALFLSIPMTVLVSGLVEGYLGDFINMETPGFVLPQRVLFLQIAIGMMVPVLAALYPVIRGTAVTVREAISDYGVGQGQFGTSWLDRLLGSIRGLSRPMRISLRNTFRRRARLILTLITLVLGGMLFMTVGSVRNSLDNRVDEALEYNQFDIQVQFGRAYRTAQIEQVVFSVPGVGEAESWGADQAIRIRNDGSESDPITITALPAESQMVKPTLVSGRWLMPEDENAIVLSQSIITDETDLQVGDEITLEIDNKQRTWVIVGFAQTTEFAGNINAYVNYPYYVQITNGVGQASSVQLQLAPTSPFTVDETVELLNAAFEDAGMDVTTTFTVELIRSFTGNFFSIIVALLLVMGVVIASVGALGLMGTMSTNVLERTREIGVMRAIGASDGAVLRIVLVEGIIIGLLSWVIGALLAFPAGFALSNAIGVALFQSPLTYAFSASGVVTWLVLVIILAAIASFLPARNASRLTVREVLAYE